MIETQMVSETLVVFNKLTYPVTWEDFVNVYFYNTFTHVSRYMLIRQGYWTKTISEYIFSLNFNILNTQIF
jgi:hypothetical protein